MSEYDELRQMFPDLAQTEPDTAGYQELQAVTGTKRPAGATGLIPEQYSVAPGDRGWAAFAPRATKAIATGKGSPGIGAALDVASLPGRTVGAGIEALANLVYGQPSGFAESMARTGPSEDMGTAESIGEAALRDPLNALLIGAPAANALRAGKYATLARYALPAGEAGAAAGTSLAENVAAGEKLDPLAAAIAGGSTLIPEALTGAGKLTKGAGRSIMRKQLHPKADLTKALETITSGPFQYSPSVISDLPSAVPTSRGGFRDAIRQSLDKLSEFRSNRLAQMATDPAQIPRLQEVANVDDLLQSVRERMIRDPQYMVDAPKMDKYFEELVENVKRNTIRPDIQVPWDETLTLPGGEKNVLNALDLDKLRKMSNTVLSPQPAVDTKGTIFTKITSDAPRDRVYKAMRDETMARLDELDPSLREIGRLQQSLIGIDEALEKRMLSGIEGPGGMTALMSILSGITGSNYGGLAGGLGGAVLPVAAKTAAVTQPLPSTLYNIGDILQAFGTATAQPVGGYPYREVQRQGLLEAGR